MIVGPRALALIRSYEQCRLKSYLPTADDVPTIGWGSTGPDIHLGMTWTQEQCDARFAADIQRFGSAVERLIEAAPTTAANFGAMVSLAYNIGEGAKGFAGSSVLRLHKLARYPLAADAFLMWTKQNKRVLPGLVKRRQAERTLYLSETPK